jgi:hypothetical protein
MEATNWNDTHNGEDLLAVLKREERIVRHQAGMERRHEIGELVW